MQGVFTLTTCGPACGRALPVRPRRLTGPWGRYPSAHSPAVGREVIGGRRLKDQCLSYSRGRCVAAANTQDAPPQDPPSQDAPPQGAPSTEEYQLEKQDDRINEFTRRMGMGTWRLKGYMDPPFAGLTAQIEGLWRHEIEGLGLFKMDKKYRFIDSMDPEQTKGVYGYTEIPSPKKGDPKWPRMQIENRVYRSSIFRKLHLELAYRQDGLQVIHCVMYPRAEYDLPILSFDMVGKNGRISLVCIDPCPVSANRTLPPIFVSLVSQLQERYHLSNNRSVPDWGKEIFSHLCVIMRPTTTEELGNFIKYTIALTQAYLQISVRTSKISSNKNSRLAEVKAAHERYAQQHLKNSSTRGVLTAAFDAEVADAYMQNVMFDSPTHDADSD